MSTCTTERWIDRVDPYGYARQAGLKVSYVAIIFFLVNAFWKAPTLAVLTMCVAGAGIALIEMPSINTSKKKDVSYIVFTLLTITTVSIFRFFSYFTVLELVAIIGWSYVLYRLIAKDTEKAQVVAIAILIGFVSLEAPGATDFWQWVNQTAFYVQFAVIAFVAHKLFPNRYMRIVHNIMRQIWLLQQRQLTEPDKTSFTAMGTDFLKHLGTLEQVQPLLAPQTREHLPALIQALWQYQHTIEAAARHADREQIKQILITHEVLLKQIQAPTKATSPIDDDQNLVAANTLSQAWSHLCQRA
ncbi:MAG TPA: hypothetical protein VIC30_12270 [Orrella sp.]